MKRKANHQIPGMNAAKSQGKGAGYDHPFQTEASNEPLLEIERQNNKKTKKRQ